MRFRCEKQNLTGVYVILLLGAAWAVMVTPVIAKQGTAVEPSGGALPLLTVVLGLIAVAGVLLAIILYYRLKRLSPPAMSNPHAESISENSEKPYQIMVENSEEGIVILQQLEFRYANRQVYDLMGMTEDVQGPYQLVDYCHPKDLDVVLEAYEKVMFGKEKSVRFSARMLKDDKSIVWVTIRFVPTVWEDAPAILAFARDITIQKMMEQDLQQAQRMEAIGALSGGIAHDFNNILTTIIGTAEVALMDLSEENVHFGEFQQVRKSGYRARDLVRQILSISRESAMDFNPLYLTPLIKEAIKLLRSTLPKEIKIKSEFEPRLKMVMADSIQMYQVFMNLCTNARDAMRGGANPCLEISLKNESLLPGDEKESNALKPGNYVIMQVRDNGCGIDSRTAPKIFEPYYTTKDQHKDTGLGLATTLGIVKKHKGHIEFESSAEKGTCFSVYLPVYDSDEEEKNDRLPGKKEAEQGGGKILFVDDEVEITMVAERMLDNMGFSVMTCNSGEKALEAFSRAPEFFDLMITDLSMPEMSGEKLAKTVLKIRPTFPVIVCTGYSDTFSPSDAQKAGIAAYVEKPYDFKALAQTIQTYIKKSKAA